MLSRLEALFAEIILQMARLKGKVAVAGVDQESTAYAGSNALALPQQKLKFKKAEAAIVGKILSKKQRKRLEKIVDVKKKKEERSSLLIALQSVQVSSLAGLESLSSVQVNSEHLIFCWVSFPCKQLHQLKCQSFLRPRE